MRPLLGITILACLVLLTPPPVRGASARQPAIRLDVDGTEAPGHILHARERIPVQGGTLTLLYPKWIPGHHAPTGPLVDVAGFHVTAGGKDVPWRRDLKEPYMVRCELPSGAREVDVTFDYLIPMGDG